MFFFSDDAGLFAAQSMAGHLILLSRDSWCTKLLLLFALFLFPPLPCPFVADGLAALFIFFFFFFLCFFFFFLFFFFFFFFFFPMSSYREVCEGESWLRWLE